MARDGLPDLLGRSVTGADDPRIDCPEADVVAAYVEGRLETPGSDRLERHLARCRMCRETVGALLRSEGETEADAPVPALVLARARRLVRAPRRRVPVWAAAATVVLAAGIALLSGMPDRDLEEEEDVRATRQSRFVPAERALPQIAFPGERMRIRASDLAVRWSAVPGARYYDVRVVDDDGDVVVTSRVAGTDWVPAAPLPLRVGAEYYVRVDAFVDEAKPQSSPHVAITIAP